jgi:hypothetical protein
MSLGNSPGPGEFPRSWEFPRSYGIPQVPEEFPRYLRSFPGPRDSPGPSEFLHSGNLGFRGVPIDGFAHRWGFTILQPEKRVSMSCPVPLSCVASCFVTVKVRIGQVLVVLGRANSIPRRAQVKEFTVGKRMPDKGGVQARISPLPHPTQPISANNGRAYPPDGGKPSI